MSYRINEHEHKHKPSVDKYAPHTIVTLVDGSSARMAFPCFYLEPIPPKHCEHWHDHIGWPSPSHPDHTCQLRTERWIREFGHPMHFWDRSFPIRFLREGYEPEATVKLYPELPGLTASAYIDPKQDWVVRLNVDAHTLEELEEPEKIRCLVTINNGDKEDVVVNGFIIVLPTAWPGE